MYFSRLLYFARSQPTICVTGAGAGGGLCLGGRKNSKPGKYLKMRQNPQRPVHAVLGGDIY